MAKRIRASRVYNTKPVPESKRHVGKFRYYNEFPFYSKDYDFFEFVDSNSYHELCKLVKSAGGIPVMIGSAENERVYQVGNCGVDVYRHRIRIVNKKREEREKTLRRLEMAFK